MRKIKDLFNFYSYLDNYCSIKKYLIKLSCRVHINLNFQSWYYRLYCIYNATRLSHLEISIKLTPDFCIEKQMVVQTKSPNTKFRLQCGQGFTEVWPFPLICLFFTYFNAFCAFKVDVLR